MDRHYEPLPEQTEKVGAQVIDSAVNVHRTLGPGLLESVYEACMVHELEKRGLTVQRNVHVPTVYDGVKLPDPLRLRMLVDASVVVEVRTADTLLPIFEAHLLTYLRLSRKRLGYILNFHAQLMKQGIRRMIN